jgi:hypothetical protein
VQGVDRGHGRLVEDTLLHQSARAEWLTLLGRLKNQHNRAPGRARDLSKERRRPDEHRAVGVMSAGVHQSWPSRGIEDSIFLSNWQRIQVSAEGNGWPGILSRDHCHYTCALWT